MISSHGNLYYMYLEESSKCCRTSTTNTNLEFYGKITGMTLHLKNIQSFLKLQLLDSQAF